jgi:hypothetical protein
MHIRVKPYNRCTGHWTVSMLFALTEAEIYEERHM